MQVVGHRPVVRCGHQDVAGQDGDLVAERMGRKNRDGAGRPALQTGGQVCQVLRDVTHPLFWRVAVQPLRRTREPRGAEGDDPLDDPAQLALDVVRGALVGTAGQSLPRRIAITRSSSMYSHTRVTTRPKAAVHANFSGTPPRTPRSMKSKSITSE